MHFWSFWAKYCHFLHILSNAQPKTNVNQVPRWVFCYVSNKTFDFSSKNQDFLPKNDQIWPEIGNFGHFGPGLAGSFGWWLWRAGCISQDAYLLYVVHFICTFKEGFGFSILHVKFVRNSFLGGMSNGLHRVVGDYVVYFRPLIYRQYP